MGFKTGDRIKILDGTNNRVYKIDKEPCVDVLYILMEELRKKVIVHRENPFYRLSLNYWKTYFNWLYIISKWDSVFEEDIL